MFTTETLQHMGQGEAIRNASSALITAAEGTDGMLALPNNFQVHDLERTLQTRRRARGTMTTSNVRDFASYVHARALAGAAVFVDPQKMQATAVLNMGTKDAPGHADDIAIYAPRPTAAYLTLQAIANGAGKTQRDVAEFLEDWGPSFVAAFHGDTEMPHGQAVAAIRRVTIESLSKAESTAEQLSASRSAFDQVKAVSGEGKLPSMFDFSCQPYVGFKERTFTLRLAVLTSGKDPALTLRIVKAEEHAEHMANDLAADVAAEILQMPVLQVPVLVGGYVARA